MIKLYNLYNEIILEEIVNRKVINESVSYAQVNDAIDKRVRVRITYKNTPESPITQRYIEVYNLGLTKAGNPVIRAYQLFGQTMTRIPRWKFFRLDRILKWEPTTVKFNTPISTRDPDAPKYVTTGDRSMSVVNKMINFNTPTPTSTNNTRNNNPNNTNNI